MNHWNNLTNIRREYGQLSLTEENVHPSPFVQFKQWFSDVLNTEKNDPTSMVLSTVDSQGHPDSRVVLLKGIDEETFVFYTNYQSKKSLQIQSNPHVALNFYWPSLARQVRVRGTIDKVSDAESDAYFASRPFTSQCSTIISPQSSTIGSRAELEHALNELIANVQQETVMRPIHWGGYRVCPDEIEFWQGRDSRLHDRVHYYRERGQWQHRRLAP